MALLHVKHNTVNKMQVYKICKSVHSVLIGILGSESGN